MSSTQQLRSQAPDVVVAVGQGDGMQEFECYKVVLALASPYFDAMLSADMIENSSSRIEFPDKDPEVWKLFYQFIDPKQNRVATLDATTSMTLIPWFHEFQMESYLKECDDILLKLIQALEIRMIPSEHNSSSGGNPPHAEERQTSFNQIIEITRCACTHDLDKSKGKSECILEYFMKKGFVETHNLFEPSVIRVLVDLTLPLEEEAGQGGNDILFKPRGKSTTFWQCLQVDFRHKELARLSKDAINNKDVLTLLIHTHFKYEAEKIKRAAEKMTHEVEKRKYAVEKRKYAEEKRQYAVQIRKYEELKERTRKNARHSSGQELFITSGSMSDSEWESSELCSSIPRKKKSMGQRRR